jgi:hypothetical protein
MPEPTFYGEEFTIGDEVGDAVPECCGSDMTKKGSKRKDRKYTCPCGASVTVDKTGLIFDISG